MNNKTNNVLRQWVTEIKKGIIYTLLINFFAKIHLPERWGHLLAITWVSAFLAYGFFMVYIFPWHQRGDNNASPSSLPVLSEETENFIERRVNDEKDENKCQGSRFDIINDLSDVGGERFSFPDKYDDHIASPAGNLYQGSKKTSWECALPFIATVSGTPKKTESIGLFLEFENVFKVIVGDGDKRSIKIEKNDGGDRGPWAPFYRRYLAEELQINKEVTLTIKAKIEKGSVRLWVKIVQPGQAKPVIIDDIPPFIPEGITLETHLKEFFRIGINDSFYKGEGSWVRLGTLSIEENGGW